jgi:hypothetical protein
MSQNYANHAHWPVATGVGYLFLIAALVGFWFRWSAGDWPTTVAIAGLIGAVVALLWISRRYVTRLQDRIIKLEMQIRCATLLTAPQQRLLAGLTNKQRVALRFASDEELPALLERASRESMAPDDIKRAIRTWVPDLDRT